MTISDYSKDGPRRRRLSTLWGNKREKRGKYERGGGIMMTIM